MIDHRVRESTSSTWLVLAVILAAAGTGLDLAQWAGARPLWLDEEMIALNLRDRGLADLAGPLWLGQSAPFGWLVLQRLALLAFGTSEVALRLVPVLFGLGTLAVAVWVGRRWMGPLGGPLLVCLCASGQWLTFYVFELKQYSSDIFWSLLLPALAVWAVRPPDGRAWRRRAVVWWMVAAAAQWFSNGALLVAPACAAVLVGGVWRRDGWRQAARAAIPGSVWALSFGAQYVLTLRDTLGNDYLRNYWAFALPPASAGLAGSAAWLASQLAPFAVKPGGAQTTLIFWAAVVAGIALLLRHRLELGLAAALIPASAFVLAVFGVAPLYERLSLWIVPALYLAIAASVDEGVAMARAAWARRRWATAGLAILVAVVGSWVSVDITAHGLQDLWTGRPRMSNHQLNDRAAIEWLESQRQPNDDLLTTHLGLPAVWWYGGIPISGPKMGNGHPDDSGRVLEASHYPWPQQCGSDVRDALLGHTRVLVYLGFRFDDVPKHFDDLLFGDLQAVGSIVAERRFEGPSRAAIVDLRLAPDHPRDETADAGGHGAQAGARLSGCVGVKTADRW